MERQTKRCLRSGIIVWFAASIMCFLFMPIHLSVPLYPNETWRPNYNKYGVLDRFRTWLWWSEGWRPKLTLTFMEQVILAFFLGLLISVVVLFVWIIINRIRAKSLSINN
jgi:hypothetical protein